MWWIIGYLIGIIICWFFVAYQRDSSEDDFEKWPKMSILFGWIFIVPVIVTLIFVILFEYLGKFKIFNPSLEYFKKYDKHREK